MISTLAEDDDQGKAFPRDQQARTWAIESKWVRDSPPGIPACRPPREWEDEADMVKQFGNVSGDLRSWSRHDGHRAGRRPLRHGRCVDLARQVSAELIDVTARSGTERVTAAGARPVEQHRSAGRRSSRASARAGDDSGLDDVSLSINAGEFVSVIGPSGCGKSTLLKVIAGLCEADGGTVTIDGRTP